MIWLLGGIGVFGGLYAVLCVLSRTPFRHRHQARDQFVRFLDALATRGVDGSMLHLHHEASAMFVQFVLREDEHGQRYLHFGFPKAP